MKFSDVDLEFCFATNYIYIYIYIYIEKVETRFDRDDEDGGFPVPRSIYDRQTYIHAMRITVQYSLLCII